MKKTLILLVLALCACDSVPRKPEPTRYTEDGRRVCRKNEPVNGSDCVAIIQGRCRGVVMDDYDAMNACI